MRMPPRVAHTSQLDHKVRKQPGPKKNWLAKRNITKFVWGGWVVENTKNLEFQKLGMVQAAMTECWPEKYVKKIATKHRKMV